MSLLLLFFRSVTDNELGRTGCVVASCVWSGQHEKMLNNAVWWLKAVPRDRKEMTSLKKRSKKLNYHI